MAREILVTVDAVVIDLATTTNALSILESALPSSVLAAIESALSSLPAAEASATSSLPSIVSASSTTLATATSTSTHHTTHETSRSTSTSIPTSTSTSSSTTTTHSSSSISSSITSSHSLSSPSTTSTATSTTASASDPMLTNAPPVANNRLPNSAIAGVATGVTAAAVLILLSLVFCLRRRQQRKYTFGALRGGGSEKPTSSIYPEVAWLYDPTRTPPVKMSHDGAGNSRTSLLPADRQIDSQASSHLLPESTKRDSGVVSPLNAADEAAIDHLQRIDPTSPLLVPPMPVMHDANGQRKSKATIRALKPSSSPETSSQSRSPSTSPKVKRDSWANNKDAWTSDPLLAPQPSSPPTSSQASSSPPQEYFSARPFTQAIMANLNGSYSSLPADRRPLTAIYEEGRGQ